MSWGTRFSGPGLECELCGRGPRVPLPSPPLKSQGDRGRNEAVNKSVRCIGCFAPCTNGMGQGNDLDLVPGMGYVAGPGTGGGGGGVRLAGAALPLL